MPSIASTQIDSLMALNKTLKGKPLVENYLSLASCYITLQHDSAHKYLSLAEESSRSISFEDGMAEVLFFRGNILYFENNYDEAKLFFNKAMELSSQTNNELLKARCLERLASLHLMTDNPNLALKYYYESLAIFEKENDLPGIAKVYNILGVYHAEMREFETAETYLSKSLEMHRKLADEPNIIQNKGNLGYMYELQGNNEKARDTYLELIADLSKKNEQYSLPVIYFNLASLQNSMGETDAAIENLLLAIDISDQTRDTALLSNLYGYFGELLLEKNLADSAKVFLMRAVQYSRAIDDIRTECSALEFLVQIDSLQQDYVSQLAKLKRIAQLKEAMHNNYINHNMEAIELDYKNRENLKFIELQEQIILKEKAETRLYIALVILAGILITILVLMVILIRRSLRKSQIVHSQDVRLKQLEIEKARFSEKLHKHQKEKAEQDLYIKSSELIATAMQVEQKHKVLDQILKEMEKVFQKAEKAPVKEDLEVLMKNIRASLHEKNNTDLFNEHFQQVHKDFFPRLKERHPELTKTELKFCAYLRVQLSSAQIATILNVTTEAIRKTRYRIRKKLKLEASESLEDYIMKV
jgi:tetratricopeptide (TPR) repeat protein